MEIELNCTHCRRQYLVSDQYAGKKVKCRHCRQTLVVPRSVAARPIKQSAGGVAQFGDSPSPDARSADDEDWAEQPASIEIACGNCGQEYQAPPELSGKQIRCRNCGTTIQVPRIHSPTMTMEMATGDFTEIVLPPLAESSAAALGFSPTKRASPVQPAPATVAPKSEREPATVADLPYQTVRTPLRSRPKRRRRTAEYVAWVSMVFLSAYLLALPVAYSAPVLGTSMAVAMLIGAVVLVLISSGWMLAVVSSETMWNGLFFLLPAAGMAVARFVYGQSAAVSLLPLALPLHPLYFVIGVIGLIFTHHGTASLLLIATSLTSLYFIQSRVGELRRPLLLGNLSLVMCIFGAGLWIMAARGTYARYPEEHKILAQQKGSAYKKFPVNEIQYPAVPLTGQFNLLEGHLDEGIQFQEILLGPPGGYPLRPGHGGRLWVYLPAGSHNLQSLGCVLTSRGGTSPLCGSQLSPLGIGHEEFIEYVRAGFAVVAFEVDGPSHGMQDAGLNPYLTLRAAQAGLVNAQIAYAYASTRLPQVDPECIYAVGHGAAGTLALLLAEHNPRIRGCVAYAPFTNLRDESQHDLRVHGLGMHWLFPGLGEFYIRRSPITHVADLRCPVFLFHAEDDDQVLYAQSKDLVERLRKQDTPVQYVAPAGGGHYRALYAYGIPAAVRWLGDQANPVGAPPRPTAPTDAEAENPAVDQTGPAAATPSQPSADSDTNNAAGQDSNSTPEPAAANDGKAWGPR